MATTRPVVVITSAAPVVARGLPDSWALRIVLASTDCTSPCSRALMLVTRSSPVRGAVLRTMPSCWPALFTDSTCWPGVPWSSWLYWDSRPAWPTRSTPENPVAGRWSSFICWAVIGPR